MNDSEIREAFFKEFSSPETGLSGFSEEALRWMFVGYKAAIESRHPTQQLVDALVSASKRALAVLDAWVCTSPDDIDAKRDLRAALQPFT